MSLSSILRPHRRWQRLIARYPDGDLGPAERLALDGHAAFCANCAARLVSTLAVTGLLRGLPDGDAPRSFRITSAMVAASSRAVIAEGSRRPRPAFALRGAQLAAGLAAAALVAVVLVDVGGNSGGDDNDVSVSRLSAEGGREAQDVVSGSVGAPVAAAAAATSAATANASATAAVKSVPTYDAGGGGAAGVAPSPTKDASRTTNDGIATAPAANLVEKPGNDATNSGPIGGAISAELRDSDDGQTLRIAEIGLAALLVAAIVCAGWLGLVRRKRS